ncbi:MAG: hypothetical protein KF862_07315 [Chitinophagaceae bacterium]|nr:hypothetical protein [Chitinophagaceae bacterium]
MRKTIVIASILLSLCSCKKIDRLMAAKYCWECVTTITAGVGSQETLRTISSIEKCDMTVAEMEEVTNKTRGSIKNNNGSWSTSNMRCTRQ